ncbi:PREDICTED: zinc finger protein DZIP1 [Papilio xuthus]|uniref:Zinc finger protein DZIP1 n=1 Tax=Papilio xuthus TaxID=66420 RepID=A0AAJ6Z7I3_PAPXU|nr:PREDICTED: zinc finger protein DZIP1 [Papilio xuthus]
MACKTSYELHHNFPKLAEESGFTFSTHKPRVHIEWNKIRLIDIESLMRDRKFVQIEQHINDILDCVLESEFDVRILDEGVLKIFRLAQLAVEYQQFCRHYLDRSVYVLREEITGLAQELEYAKKTIREKDDEIRKLKRKTKYNIRTPLPYGNDNIANMILQTLANKSDIFPSSNQIDNVHYNKCSYCDKVFMNHLYLKSHISRRHSNVVEIPQKDLPRNENIQIDNEQSKLQNEVIELKSKLQEMEVLLKVSNDQSNRESNTVTKENTKETTGNCSNNQALKINESNIKSPQKQMKDVEVSTNSEVYILDKIEEWKREEFEKYNKEIGLLRTQISNILDYNKDIVKTNSVPNDNKIMEQLQETIKQQSAEIASLKDELTNSRLKSKNDELERKKEIDAQIALWAERTEAQSKEYKLLLQKLDIVAKEAKESRELAELEKQRAVKLQHLLEQNSNKVENCVEIAVIHKENDIKTENRQNRNNINENLAKHAATVESPKKSTPMPDRKTLEKLHRKAQELLNQSITSSDVSSTSDSNNRVPIEKRNVRKTLTNHKKRTNEDIFENGKHQIHNKDRTNTKKARENRLETHKNIQSPEIKKNKPPTKKDTVPLTKSGSPIKVIRAKLTEEVNQRLVSLGVDPLRKRLPRDIFNKQRLQLQENNEIKSKKNPAREKINHYIMSYLDKKATITKKKTLQEDDYFSPNKSSKPFSLTSVISNVKSKALSLVKTNDGLRKEEKTPYDSVTRKALSLLKTPPGSTATSPKINKQNLDNQIHDMKKSIKIIEEKEKPHKLTNSFVDKNSESSEESESNPTNISDEKPNQNFKSPNRRPAISGIVHDYNMQGKSGDTRTMDNAKHITNAFEKTDSNKQKRYLKIHSSDNSSDDNIASITEHGLRNAISDENVNDQKQTKGVLKSASSMSSLYKKKVLFDMDAIQMKSVSASPSQSITEKSDKNEKTELGIINLDTEEWDLSSIENEPLKERTIKLSTRTSPKIAELKQSIESQLTRRNPTLSTALVGGVDVLQGPTMTKAASLGSNTSLGSSILDDSEFVVHQNHTAFVKPKKLTDKDDSEIDISEVVDDIIDNKHKSFKK